MSNTGNNWKKYTIIDNTEVMKEVLKNRVVVNPETHQRIKPYPERNDAKPYDILTQKGKVLIRGTQAPEEDFEDACMAATVFHKVMDLEVWVVDNRTGSVEVGIFRTKERL